MGIQKYKKQKISDRRNQQKEVNRAKCATLYRKYRDREWILDDESYFTKTHSSINENDNFYSENIDFAPANENLEESINTRRNFLSGLLCQPVGFQSRSSWLSGNAVDQFVYRDNCLAPRLLPFIKKKSF